MKKHMIKSNKNDILVSQESIPYNLLKTVFIFILDE